jgi:hypothetical protein
MPARRFHPIAGGSDSVSGVTSALAGEGLPRGAWWKIYGDSERAAAQLSAADIQVRRMNASVLLVKALGGGWEG